MKKIIFIFAICLQFAFAEEMDLGTFDPFGDSSTSFDDSSDFGVDFGGSFKLGTPIFFKDFADFSNFRASSLISASFHLNAYAPVCEAYASVSLNDTTLPFNFFSPPRLYPDTQIPRFIDEVYLQGNLGPVVLGGGLKKRTWGVADSFSLLDVLNPQDLSDLTITDTQKLKKSRPMLYLSAYLPQEMKLDICFLPVFEGNTYALEGPWRTQVFDSLVSRLFKAPSTDPSLASTGVEKLNRDFHAKTISVKDFHINPIDTGTLRYAQAGIRYTATIASYHDIGIQYYYGFLPKPAMRFDTTNFLAVASDYESKGTSALQSENAKTIFYLDYTPVHQIGLDYGVAFGPISIRAELAALITHDIKGTNPAMYNPSLAWNFGIDYTAPFGLMVNFCASESINLLHKPAQQSALDIEWGAPITDTNLMLLLTQTLVRGAINLNLRTTMHVETLDFILAPSFEFSYGALIIGLESQFYFGRKDAPLNKNHNMTVSLSYNF